MSVYRVAPASETSQTNIPSLAQQIGGKGGDRRAPIWEQSPYRSMAVAVARDLLICEMVRRGQLEVEANCCLHCQGPGCVEELEQRALCRLRLFCLSGGWDCGITYICNRSRRLLGAFMCMPACHGCMTNSMFGAKEQGATIGLLETLEDLQ